MILPDPRYGHFSITSFGPSKHREGGGITQRNNNDSLLMMSLLKKIIQCNLESLGFSPRLCTVLFDVRVSNSHFGWMACAKTVMCGQVYGTHDSWWPWNSKRFVFLHVTANHYLQYLTIFSPSFSPSPSVSSHNKHQQVIFLEPWVSHSKSRMLPLAFESLITESTRRTSLTRELKRWDSDSREGRRLHDNDMIENTEKGGRGQFMLLCG